uniref:Uncharacterized protein n=1 Tax=Trichobilharzia regenti TaxID=157069 RepID=A0AA85IXH7_TRIRE|nr:unnamed protein product [Trichobilharzia regenti]
MEFLCRSKLCEKCLNFRTQMFRISNLFSQQIALWSAAINFVCCKMADFNCYFLLGFVIQEDVLTIIAFIYVRRFKLVVMMVLISSSMAFLVTGAVLIYLDTGERKYSELAGGFWNTAIATVALVFVSLLK